MKTKSVSWRKRDRQVLWHPFTQMKDWEKELFPVIVKGEGNELIDADGKRYLDGVSSLWCNVFGHQVPKIDQAVQKQLKKIAHTTFLGSSHPLAIELAEKILKQTPKNLSRVFYSDSGSEAVEIALKIAFQYWQQSGKKSKKKFIKIGDAYHGDTLGSVSVGGIELFHHVYGPLLFNTFTIPSPAVFSYGENEKTVLKKSINILERILKKHHREIAALVMEPLVQGAAGMLMHSQGFLKQARALTKKYGVLLILDEVATGFGRTGTLFACEQEKVLPDILCLAKGLTGGYLPLAATLTTEKIYKAFLGRYEELKTFFHGHTYTANPLACAAAIATLDLFQSQKTIYSLRSKIEQLQKGLECFWDLPWVGDIRQKGLMAGIEIFENPARRQYFSLSRNVSHRIIQRARGKGVLLRPLGPVLVIMPPLSITGPEIDKLLQVLYESIYEELKQLK